MGAKSEVGSRKSDTSRWREPAALRPLNPERVEGHSALRRHGMTLIELLVVLVILLLITAATLPMMTKATEGRKQREAARLVNGFLHGARARALEIGRPVGVRIDRFQPGQEFGVVLSYVEVPPPYAGDSLDARCSLALISSTPNGATPRYASFLVAVMAQSQFPPETVSVGDVLRLDYHGLAFKVAPNSTEAMQMYPYVEAPGQPPKWFNAYKYANGAQAADNDPDGDKSVLGPAVVVVVEPGSSILPSWTPPPLLPYQFIRSPVKSGGEPLRLPEGAVVDMHWSGVGSDPSSTALAFSQPAPPPPPDAPPSEAYPIVIMFAPNGSVSSVSGPLSPQGGPSVNPIQYTSAVTAPVYLLIGKIENVAKAVPAGPSNSPPGQRADWNTITTPNWSDLENLWVSVSPQNGQIITAQVHPNAPTDPVPSRLAQSRFFAQQSQQLGGR